MTPNRLGLKLIGEMVTVSYVADPSFGHGKFRLENHDAVTVEAAVESAWLELGERVQSLADVSIFDLSQDQMVNPKSLKVDAGAIMNFLVGFPRIAYEPHFGEVVNVGLRLRVNGVKLEALSPIKFVHRIPYRL